MDTRTKSKVKDIELQQQDRGGFDMFRDQFFANLSHELNTPINAIYSALQLEEFFIKENDMDSIKKYNEVIKNNCFRMLRTCNNLIDMTEIDSGLIKPHIKYCNIVELAENAVASAVPYIKKKGMQVVLDKEIEEEYIFCDPEMFERVILNLLSNSVKYGKTGGHIWIFLNNRMDEVEIRVKDDGAGIPEDIKNSIFEKFTKADTSLNRNVEGNGMGLSLVKAIVELHGGSISFTSKEDEGTEFLICIPNCIRGKESYRDLRYNIKAEMLIERASIEFSDIYFD